MAATLAKRIGKINQGDCIQGLQTLPDGCVDLAFADPPFNIGFKYDEYQDELESDQYITWSRDWMQEIHRVLKANGTFWLAIGDEYAAELKLEAQKLGFQCRSWVVWYYTFGVHCKMKFTRSHAHLFHFVKDDKDFIFNHDDLDLRVPSARQLVYNDARANPHGRMPDDTWILRPQDLVNGFDPDEDVWYFPRVAGTFKERAGFHGCQMPEQLLGRIIRACSNPEEIIIDPFSGSATTLAVAKKLGRQFLGFELSRDYVKLGTQRLANISVGDRLDGSEEPTMNGLSTKEKQEKKSRKTGKSKTKVDPAQKMFAWEAEIHDELAEQTNGILEAFSRANRGYSVDRLVADPVMNEDFQNACDRLSVTGTAAERNRFLLRLRKAGDVRSAGIMTTEPTNIGWKQIGSFVFASEIAWRQIATKYGLTLEEIFCDPRMAVQFDKIASDFAPGHEPLDYRWAALKLRKEGSQAKRRAASCTAKQLGISKFKHRNLKNLDCVQVADLDFDSLSPGPGVYLIREPDGNSLYAGETEQLAARLATTFDAQGPASHWASRSCDLELFVLPVASVTDHRLARQSLLLKWHEPEWNSVRELAV